jgi:hypothetical protein
MREEDEQERGPEGEVEKVKIMIAAMHNPVRWAKKRLRSDTRHPRRWVSVWEGAPLSVV